MTWTAWLPGTLGILNLISLGYWSVRARRLRRRLDEADRYLAAAEDHHARTAALLTHMMTDHGHLHKEHSHEDSDFAPRVH